MAKYTSISSRRLGVLLKLDWWSQKHHTLIQSCMVAVVLFIFAAVVVVVVLLSSSSDKNIWCVGGVVPWGGKNYNDTIRCGSFDYTPNQLSRRFGARFLITLLEYGRTLHSRRQDRERELHSKLRQHVLRHRQTCTGRRQRIDA